MSGSNLSPKPQGAPPQQAPSSPVGGPMRPPYEMNGSPSWEPPRPNDGGIPWNRYLAAFRRFRWLMAAIVMLGAAGGVVLARRTVPEYEATAMIWINNSGNQQAQRGPIRAGELLESSSWVELLRSYAVADAVVKQLRLDLWTGRKEDQPLLAGFQRTSETRNGTFVLAVDSTGQRYALKDVNKRVIERGLVGDSVGRTIGAKWLPARRLLTPGKIVTFGIVPVRVASTSVLNGLVAILPEQGSFMRVAMRGSDPVRTSAILNAVVEQFVASATVLQRRKVVELKGLLESQLTLAERDLRSAELALRDFQSRAGPAASQSQDPMIGNYFLEQAERENVRRDRETLERALDAAPGASVTVEGLLAVPGLVASMPTLQAAISELTETEARLRAARQTFTDEHPTVRALRAAVANLRQTTIPQIARGALAQLQMRERALDSRLAETKAYVNGIPPRVMEEGRLRRQVAGTENLYTMLRARYEEARLAELGASPDVSILDVAAPPSYPSSNPGPRLLLLVIVASCGLAVGVALALDRLDPKVRYIDQATDELGLAIVGAVPHMRRDRRGTMDVELASRAVEAFRSIRLSLRFALGQATPMQLAISSPCQGDGKSFMSANIALAFAQSGLRTLLIDGDMRRGELHKVFGVPRTPGLADYLAGDDEPGATHYVATQEPLLQLIPSGTRRARSPELLTGSRMHALWQDARQRYDVLIIDTPPLSAGIDAYALAAQAGSLLVVLRTGATDRKLAAAKLDVVERLPINILGTVLNDVPDGGVFEQYEYAYHYNVEDGEDPWRALPDVTVTTKD